MTEVQGIGEWPRMKGIKGELEIQGKRWEAEELGYSYKHQKVNYSHLMMQQDRQPGRELIEYFSLAKVYSG